MRLIKGDTRSLDYSSYFAGTGTEASTTAPRLRFLGPSLGLKPRPYAGIILVAPKH